MIAQVNIWQLGRPLNNLVSSDILGSRCMYTRICKPYCTCLSKSGCIDQLAVVEQLQPKSSIIDNCLSEKQG